MREVANRAFAGIPAPRGPVAETARVQALDTLGLFDAPAEDALQSICRLAARLCGVRNAVINIFDRTHQRPLAYVGDRVSPVPREQAMCQLVVASGEAISAADAATEERFSTNPFVDGRLAAIRFYLSLPLTIAEGHVIGTLCVYDVEPRELRPDQTESVTILAEQVVSIFQLRRAGSQIAALAERATAAELETREILANASDAFLSVDAAGRITAWNDAAEATFGHAASEAIGRQIADLILPGERRNVFAQRMAEAAGSKGFRVDAPEQLRTLHADGSERLVQPRIWATRTAEGSLKGFHAFLRDTTAEVASELGRRAAEHLFQTAFEQAPIGMAILDVREDNRGEIVRANQALMEQIPHTELVGTHFSMLLAEEWVADAIDTFGTLAEGAIDGCEGVRKVTVDGETHGWFQVKAALIRDSDGAPMHALLQVRDVTRERAHEEWLTKQATSDPLTGLPNRLSLMHRLEAELTDLRTSRSGVGVLFLDVDGFKGVNDGYGHAAGDDVLRRVARHLEQTVPARAMAGRLGGDEFAVVFSADSSATLTAYGAALADAVTRIAGYPGVGASIGWGFTRDPATAAGELLASADERMYEQKRARKLDAARLAD